MTTPGHIQQIMPQATMSNIEKYLPVFLKYKDRYEVNTPERMAMYWAQVAHESQQLSRVEENLNYSEIALLKTWPKRFDIISAHRYARNPEKIANKVYANRLENGNEASGDGWKYRGRGAIQNTGKINYKHYSLDTYGDDRILKNPDLLLQPEDAIRSSLWFWKTKGLNKSADARDIVKNTAVLNGGDHGLKDRKEKYERALKSFLN